jgi:hypothetical protein
MAPVAFLPSGIWMSRFGSKSRLARSLAVSLFVVVAASCGGGGGDGGTTTPSGKVTRVEITSPSPTMEVGQSMQITVRYYDAANAQLNGRTISYSTSNSAVATITTSGLITAAAPGSVTITATVEGVQGNVNVNVNAVPVFFILITPPNPAVRQGESITLSAQPQNQIGQPLPGRTITWSSANVARATITQAGVVSGITPGNVYIRAATEGRVDSVNLRVRSLVTPTITGTSSVTLVPGGTGSLTGTNFGATVADNEILLNGVPATVTSATATSVTFTVPAKELLPCTATGPAQVALLANGDTAVASVFLRVATDRSLAVGQSLLLTAGADLVCNEFAGTSGRYLITAFNYATDAAIRTSFRLTGSGTGSVAAASSAIASTEQPAPPRAIARDDPASRHLMAHANFMRQDRDLVRQLGSPRLMQRARFNARGISLSQAAIAPPAVGEQKSYRMRRTINSVSTYDEVNFRVVYSGTKMVILEDNASPRAGKLDA